MRRLGRKDRIARETEAKDEVAKSKHCYFCTFHVVFLCSLLFHFIRFVYENDQRVTRNDRVASFQCALLCYAVMPIHTHAYVTYACTCNVGISQIRVASVAPDDDHLSDDFSSDEEWKLRYRTVVFPEPQQHRQVGLVRKDEYMIVQQEGWASMVISVCTDDAYNNNKAGQQPK